MCHNEHIEGYVLSLRTYHSAGYAQMPGHQPHILPILLPFASFISPGFVPCVPISHEQSGNIITLLPEILLRRNLVGMQSTTQHTWSCINLAVTEESTPPDMATTTKPVACQQAEHSWIQTRLPFSPLSGCSFRPAFVVRRRLVKLRGVGWVKNRSIEVWVRVSTWRRRLRRDLGGEFDPFKPRGLEKPAQY